MIIIKNIAKHKTMNFALQALRFLKSKFHPLVSFSCYSFIVFRTTVTLDPRVYSSSIFFLIEYLNNLDVNMLRVLGHVPRQSV